MRDLSRSSIEEYPLNKETQCRKPARSYKGPLRVLRLCILGVIVPALLIAVPLYMRYHVYGYQLYPLAMSDMRLLDNKVSTTWCQRQRVNVNTSFNAFLLPSPPKISSDLKPLSMVRHLQLGDDTKEYWGFYLLQGSSVTVSTCVRWPGASLIIIRGHKHLHECAYIGDNSSEELDELMEAIREGVYVPAENSTDAPANQPNLMKRHRQEVEFHHPSHKNNSKHHTIDHQQDSSEITDPKEMKKLLETIQEKADKHKKHIPRNSTVAKSDSKFIKIQPPTYQATNKTSNSDELLNRLLSQLNDMGEKGSEVLERLNQRYRNTERTIDMKGRHYSKPSVDFNDNIDKLRRRKRELILSTAQVLNEHDERNNQGIEEGFNPDGIADHRGVFNDTALNDMSNSEFWSSFSSSEEALLNCAGLILNLPLTPHHKCSEDLTEEEAEETYLANTITYKIPTNGYYFFVFSSENEVQTNYIRVKFHLQKTVYDVSNSVSICSNDSTACAMDLKFFSSEKVVMELPVRGNDSLWNEEFIVVSECEPRTALYVICVMLVPIFVMLFAFS